MLGRASIYASVGASVWLAGYVYGYLVAEREGVDSDPEDRFVSGGVVPSPTGSFIPLPGERIIPIGRG